jgi:hypothetical protein
MADTQQNAICSRISILIWELPRRRFPTIARAGNRSPLSSRQTGHDRLPQIDAKGLGFNEVLEVRSPLLASAANDLFLDLAGEIFGLLSKLKL